MHITYRTYLFTQESMKTKMVPNGYFRCLFTKQQAMPNYANQDIQVFEAQIIVEKDGTEILRGIKVWYLKIDDQGYIKNRSMHLYDSREIKKIEQDYILKNNDDLLQSYVDGLLSDETNNRPVKEKSQSVSSRISTFFKTLNPAEHLLTY
ncbi:hypothetical protein [Methylophaga thiooxydans]|nr:hypothetical protein [Methylophaga thiooxydans]